MCAYFFVTVSGRDEKAGGKLAGHKLKVIMVQQYLALTVFIRGVGVTEKMMPPIAVDKVNVTMNAPVGSN